MYHVSINSNPPETSALKRIHNKFEKYKEAKINSPIVSPLHK
jgi:hypothetical protein